MAGGEDPRVFNAPGGQALLYVQEVYTLTDRGTVVKDRVLTIKEDGIIRGTWTIAGYHD